MKTNHLSNQKVLDNIESNDKSLIENQHTLDSLFTITKSINPKSSQLIDIASKAYNLELYDQYFRYSKEINQIATKNNDSLLVAKSLWYIGDYYDYKMQLDSAYIYFDQAEQIYLNTKSYVDVAKMQQYKSIVLFREGLYNEAENKALEALEILERLPKDRLLYEINLNLGNILDLNQQPNEALLYYSEAIYILEDLYKNKLISTEEFLESKAHCYNNIGTLYHTQKSYLNSETYLSYGYNNLIDLNQQNELYTIILTNLGTLNISLNKLNIAEKLLNESLTISLEKNYKQSLTANNFRLGELALKKKDTIEAINYYKTTYQLSTKAKANNTILKSLKALSLTDKQEATKYISLYYAFNDSINKLQISKRNKFARIKYESEKLEKNIVNLKKENSQLLITSIIIVLIAIILLFIILYRNKIKKYTFLKQDQENKELIFKLLLEQEQLSHDVLTKERERISQELHDGIINSLFIVRLSLGNSKDNLPILHEIEKVQNQIRLISHDLKNHEFIQQGFSEIISKLVVQNSTNQQKFQLIISKNYKWDKVSYDDKINIYRILQEAIQNVIKHSHAKNCIISIFKTETSDRITITDDGIGFNYSKVRNSNGLKNINNRAKQLHASLEVNSTTQGTVIIINIPH
ncbi:tetratricopeptide repeat-containing sensor histidine kinase [Myroides odoratimimus]|uniref:tetratricopeptide repeat-containing sensor histidine kinase n=1 Tax=Myroides odoratimimus TaxID=76832 RepID=UPI001CE10C2F|nr:tetratricopeptide repeat-containing sensor histidine kinase [Myroides odoratimimus]MCO7724885.1 histidine kinase [Myroides odoratimimus]MEC4008306.1 ATP-binding protein [Myroides odoratimimus]MEC4035694.1 ATP-binding protein [Myroides odoratimimus]MEC4043982.1 ATP-binding protein [Myroides odoratimimus]MEC4076929.1 ATP-binding protein [Myroides odoratimimus]